MLKIIAFAVIRSTHKIAVRAKESHTSRAFCEEATGMS